MIVADLYLGGIPTCPTETNPPLIVDPDGIQPLSVSLQCLESVSRRDRHIMQSNSLIELNELSQRNSGNPGKPRNSFSLIKRLRLEILKGVNQGILLCTVTLGEFLLPLTLIRGGWF